MTPEELSTRRKERWPVLFADKPKPPAPLDQTAIVLGRDHNDYPVGFEAQTRLQHALWIGATGGGKTHALAHCVKQMIQRGEGALVVDPHGNDDEGIFRRALEAASRAKRDVRIIDFGSGKILGFNPLYCPPGTDPSVIVGTVRQAILSVWDTKSLSTHPTIERVLNIALYALVDLGLTLCELEPLLDREDRFGLRQHAIEKLSDARARWQLQQLDALSKDHARRREYDQEIVGPANRVARVLGPRVLRAMLGQNTNCLDLAECMDRGEIVLVNSAGAEDVFDEDADLFVRLLIRSTLFHAVRRASPAPGNKRRTFNVVFDEAYRYLTPDIDKALPQVRKYGVSITASITWLSQAEQGDPAILQALLNGTNIKVIFRQRDPDDAERLARGNIPVNLERSVRLLEKATVTGHRIIRLKNDSEGVNQSTTDTESVGKTKGRSDTEGETHGATHADITSESDVDTLTDMQSSSSGSASGASEGSTEIALPVDSEVFQTPFITRVASSSGSNSGNSSGSSSGSARNRGSVKTRTSMDSESYAFTRAVTKMVAKTITRGTAQTRGTNTSTGTSEALEPIMEVRPTAVHSLQNELHVAGRLLRELPTGRAFVAFVGSRGPVATLVTIPPIYTKPLPEDAFRKLRDAVLQKNGAVPIDDALRTIEERTPAIPVPQKPARKPGKPTKPARKLSPRPDENDEEQLWKR